MSWDLSSEEVICNKLESQQTVIFAFSKKIKELEVKNDELEKNIRIQKTVSQVMDIQVQELESEYRKIIGKAEKKLADEMGLSDRYLLRCQELEKKLEIVVKCLKDIKYFNNEFPKYHNDNIETILLKALAAINKPNCE